VEDNYWTDLIWLRFPASATILVDGAGPKTFQVGERELSQNETIKQVERLLATLVGLGIDNQEITVEIGDYYFNDKIENPSLREELKQRGINAKVAPDEA
jgi:hypothetical protein